MISPASIACPSYSPADDGRNDLVERHFDAGEILPQAQPQRQKCARQLARHGDRERLQIVDRHRPPATTIGP